MTTLPPVIKQYRVMGECGQPYNDYVCLTPEQAESALIVAQRMAATAHHNTEGHITVHGFLPVLPITDIFNTRPEEFWIEERIVSQWRKQGEQS